MRLITFTVPGDPRPRLGAHRGAQVVDLAAAPGWTDGWARPPRDLVELLALGEVGLARAAAAVARAEECRSGCHPAAAARLLAPLLRPPKVIAVGRNYRGHVREAKVKQPDMPKLFAKYAATIVGPGDAIIKPALTDEVDFEAELAVVVGRPGRAIQRGDALSHIAGYTVANDVSARDIQFHDEQLTLAKNFRTFAPMGPWLVTRDEVADPGELDIRLWLNGNLMQDSNTRDLVFDIPHLVAFISAAMDLEAGDVILTGTPSGVGYTRTPPVFLRPGDTVRIEVQGVGVLENPVAAQEPAIPFPGAGVGQVAAAGPQAGG
ncbi:MAG TPA: fumarylacetoacetate hydrolase family protein [Verrucomicrobiae bacterium]|nr:fumarylacetoacetate hydrolase family protein [Verrucomicrobiae bacterium]